MAAGSEAGSQYSALVGVMQAHAAFGGASPPGFAAAASRKFDASPSEGGLGQIPEHSTEVSRVAAAGGLGMDVHAGAGADARGSSDRHRHRVSGWMDGRKRVDAAEDERKNSAGLA